MKPSRLAVVALMAAAARGAWAAPEPGAPDGDEGPAEERQDAEGTPPSEGEGASEGEEASAEEPPAGPAPVVVPAQAPSAPPPQAGQAPPVLWPFPPIPPNPVDPDAADVLLDIEEAGDDPPCKPVLDRQDAVAMPARSPEALLRAVPGLHAWRRYGHGGPWQFQYRGFDAGHGRDLAVELDGVPLNGPSHLLDAGMVDLTFLPFAVVEGLTACPGSIRPDVGAFGTAASLHLRVGFPAEGVRFSLGGGSDGSGALMVGYRPRGWDAGTFVIGEIDGGEGSGQDRGWRHLRLMGGISRTMGPVHASALVALYDGRNDVPVLLREDDVESGRRRYLGGDLTWRGLHVSRRLLVRGSVARPWAWGGVRVIGWLGAQGFRILDNRTGYLDNPETGDGVEQRQSSFEVGLRADVQRVFRVLADRTVLDAGIDLQAHFLHQREHALDLSRERLSTDLDRWIEHGVVAAWARARVGFFRRAHLTASVRLDQTDLGVRRLSPGDRRGEVDQVGGSALTAAPKVSGAVDLGETMLLHAAFSRGFRPPDGRVVVEDRPLLGTRVDTVSGGLRGNPGGMVGMDLQGFAAWAPAEVIADALDGRTLERAPTRRAGVTAQLAVSPLPRVRVIGDVTWVDARARDTGLVLPYVAAWQGSVGVYAEDVPVDKVEITGGLRAWWLGPRALPGGFSDRFTVSVDVSARVQFGRWFFDGAIDNAIPYRWRQAEFFFPSRWNPQSRRSLLPVRHLAPFQPPAIRLSVGAHFR